MKRNSWKSDQPLPQLSTLDVKPRDCEDNVSNVTSTGRFTPVVDTEPVKRSERIMWRCWSYFREYCSSTSIHGLKYIGERKRPILERLFWVFMFAVSIFMCSRMIYTLWRKWDSSPVIVSFAEKTTTVWQVPFPAVTVCSENKSRQRVFNFTEAFHAYVANLSDLSSGDRTNMTDQQLEYFRAVSLVCDQHLVQDGNKTTDVSTVNILRKVAPSFNEMLWFCKWKNEFKNCSNYFSEIVTEEGVCYTFNVLNADDLFRKEALHDEYQYLNHGKKNEGWSLETGYPPELGTDTYPVRGLGAGAGAGLFLLLRAYDYDLDYLCKGPVQGFKILLHHPAEIPRLSQQYYRVPLHQEVIISVKPNMMTTSEGLRHYAPHRRQCYFPSERKLRYFKVYTQGNCELECLTNHTQKKCGCVVFSMPRDRNMPICASGSAECVKLAQDGLLAKEIEQELKNNYADPSTNTGHTDCDCLPSCTSIKYDAEISQATFDWQKMFMAFKINSSEEPGIVIARLSIFFKETQFITSRRSELYGQTDFLANCGGLLGLFMGFSILSFVEILYFLSLRLGCTMRMRRNHVVVRVAPPQNADKLKGLDMVNVDLEKENMKAAN